MPPTLLETLAGGRRIVESLNVEFAAVSERRADLVLLLEDETILHIDFQAYNDRKMPYRAGIYGLMIVEKYERPIEQVVLYTGQERLNMRRFLNAGGITVSYELLDVRELDADELLKSGRPGDCVLAILARGGVERIAEIIRQAQQYPKDIGAKVLTELKALSGLRKMSEEVKMKVMRAGIEETWGEHAFFRAAWDDGNTKGKAEGKAEGMKLLLSNLISTKFGPLPETIRFRLDQASPDELERWFNQALSAPTLESVFEKQ